MSSISVKLPPIKGATPIGKGYKSAMSPMESDASPMVAMSVKGLHGPPSEKSNNNNNLT